MARQLYQPHDNLFRKVFADATGVATNRAGGILPG